MNNSALTAYAKAGSKRTAARTRSIEDRTSVQSMREQFVAAVLETVQQIRSELDMWEGTYEMANVRPERTGLPFIVYISEKGNSRHASRVKVSKSARPTSFDASVSIEPDVNVVAGDLPASDLALLRQWINLNKDTLLGYWNGDIAYTEDALAALKPIAGSVEFED